VRPTRPNPITRRQDTGSELTVQAFWTEQALLSSVTMRLAAQPEDAVVYYLMLDETDPVPAMGDAAWMLYTGPRTIDATDSTVKVVAYAQLGGKLSRVYTWMVDAGRTASLLAVTAATPSSGVVRLSWVPDVDTQRVDIYQVIDWSGDGYPTSDGTTSGTMIGVARVAQIGVDALAGGTYNGTARSGGTTLDVSGLTTGQVVGWGLVPFDRYGRVGDVAFLKYTVPASPSAALLSWNFDSIDTSGATDKGTVSWTPNALVTTSHKLRFTLLAQDYVYEVATITNPVGTTSAVLDMGVVHSTAKNSARYTFSWKIDLLTSANVLVASYKTKGLTDTVLELAL
jgi:hypothetical protein